VNFVAVNRTGNLAAAIRKGYVRRIGVEYQMHVCRAAEVASLH
jgi:hypothetical protein